MRRDVRGGAVSRGLGGAAERAGDARHRLGAELLEAQLERRGLEALADLRDELLGRVAADDDALAGAQLALPEQPLEVVLERHLLLPARHDAHAPVAVERVPLVHEDELAVLDLAQPAVVGVADARLGAAVGELGEDRRHLDVAGLGDPRQLAADPDRVADVLERRDADGEVEVVVRPRPRLAVAHVAHDPGVLGEALRAGAVAARDEAAARLVRHDVEDVRRAVEGGGPPAHVEDERVLVEHPEDALGVLGDHGAEG